MELFAKLFDESGPDLRQRTNRTLPAGDDLSLVLALGAGQIEQGSRGPCNLVRAAWLEVNLSAPVAHPCLHAGDFHLDAFFLKFLNDRSSSESAPANGGHLKTGQLRCQLLKPAAQASITTPLGPLPLAPIFSTIG